MGNIEYQKCSGMHTSTKVILRNTKTILVTTREFASE